SRLVEARERIPVEPASVLLADDRAHVARNGSRRQDGVQLALARGNRSVRGFTWTDALSETENQDCIGKGETETSLRIVCADGVSQSLASAAAARAACEAALDLPGRLAPESARAICAELRKLEPTARTALETTLACMAASVRERLRDRYLRSALQT